MIFATTEVELELSRFGTVIGMDEVGRGALAGPVAVGACVSPGEEPSVGLADSKKLSPRAREQLFENAAQWAWPAAVGMASVLEVDELGVSGALQRAGFRALRTLVGLGVKPGVVLLDGSYDWLTPRVDLFDQAGATGVEFLALGEPRVQTLVKADASCSVVAAASIVAKVARDHLMQTIPDPGYGWASNKGYASAGHREALTRLGVSAYHRRSWNLLGK